MEQAKSLDPKVVYGPIIGSRWIQLTAGVVAMIVISNFQYAFTLFTPGLKQTFASVPYAQIALIFTLFILFETWPVPLAGYLIDKFGIRNLMLVGSVGITLGWVLGGTVATTVFHLYICYGAIAGCGAGIIYIATVANAVKWFPDKRGLAAGLTAAGFGGGAALTLIPIDATIKALGWASAMATWGVGQGVIAIAAALILRHPPTGWLPASWTPPKAVAQTRKQFNAKEMLTQNEFYIMYLMFLMVCTGGLMTTGNMSQIAKSLHVFDAKVWGIAIVPFVATLAGVTNAFARIMWGAISDRFGREYTMAFAFAFEGVLIFLMTQIADSPVAFMVIMPFVFLAWGEIYALFSAITGDIFGPKNATGNYGILYTAKGLSSILAGYGAALVASYYAGSFVVPYYIAATFDIASAICALLILRPLIRTRIAKEVRMYKAVQATS
ncbi:MAG: oxalate/formate MFS antiporter [Deltaproteobacteria bacterium]|nr:oxalate/formate MFS antiporter [Deltaproteobacteria bacterium]